jgi:hypothetical protein
VNDQASKDDRDDVEPAQHSSSDERECELHFKQLYVLCGYYQLHHKNLGSCITLNSELAKKTLVQHSPATDDAQRGHCNEALYPALLAVAAKAAAAAVCIYARIS